MNPEFVAGSVCSSKATRRVLEEPPSTMRPLPDIIRLLREHNAAVLCGPTITGHLAACDMKLAFVSGILALLRPQSICEIGFNAGHSARLFLEMCPGATVHSIDPVYNKTAVHLLEKLFPDRFIFYHGASTSVMPRMRKEGCVFDFFFVDGDHALKSVESDIALCIAAYKHPRASLLLDDFDASPLFVQKAIRDHLIERGCSMKAAFPFGVHPETEVTEGIASPIVLRAISQNVSGNRHMLYVEGSMYFTRFLH
jgi:predicted O-methyltransferase YrrM